jgi:hypothetical protein
MEVVGLSVRPATFFASGILLFSVCVGGRSLHRLRAVRAIASRPPVSHQRLAIKKVTLSKLVEAMVSLYMSQQTVVFAG